MCELCESEYKAAHESCEAVIRRLEQELTGAQSYARALETTYNNVMADARAATEAQRRLEQERERLTLEMETWKHGLRDFYTSRLAEVEQRLGEALRVLEALFYNEAPKPDHAKAHDPLCNWCQAKALLASQKAAK
jgi:chromosome segregation ATPase